MWKEERANKNVTKGTPEFYVCCGKGQIKLPKAPPTLLYLRHLYNDPVKGKNFKKIFVCTTRCLHLHPWVGRLIILLILDLVLTSIDYTAGITISLVLCCLTRVMTPNFVSCIFMILKMKLRNE